MSERPDWPPISTYAIATGIDADIRLRQMGLMPDKLIAAIDAGAGAYRSTTRDHPPSYGGQRMWAETTRTLRSLTRSEGWEPEDLLGVALTLHRERGMAVIVTAGDGATAELPPYSPQVRYERQDVIQRLVNGEADTLFGRRRPPQWDVWLLLHHVWSSGWKAELARPSLITNRGMVSEWSERIIITPESERVRELTEPRSEIDVAVSRRA